MVGGTRRPARRRNPRREKGLVVADRRGKSDTPPQVAPRETAEILTLAKKCLPLDGDFVEFGCYRGDTSIELAKILRGDSGFGAAQGRDAESDATSESAQPDLGKNKSAQPDFNADESAQPKLATKRLWLYDSFAGLPPKSAEDESAAGDQFKAGELPTTKRALVERFQRAGLPRPIVKKAFFDQLDPARDLPDKIAFAFLDGDLYHSIRTSFNLVYPRLSPGAIVIVHDYNNPELPGAAKAVDEFLRAHGDLTLSTRFTLAVITKRR